MQFEHLKYNVENYIAVITLDRPPVNALNRTLVSELASVSDLVEQDIAAGKTRVAIITASGKLFSAGADLKERLGMQESDVAPVVKNIGAAINKLANISAPTIAALQGSALGGGFEVALAADIRIMASGIQVGLRETALAIIPGAGGTQRLTRIAGPANAILWVTSARLFTAEEALQHRVANLVVPANELMQQAMQLANQIAGNGPLAVRQAKKAILQGMDLPLAQGLELEFECYQNIIPTEDRREGLKSFQEKRQPDYKGQ